MSLRAFSLWMTGIAVVSDSMLHPFYPHYFASVFGVHDEGRVGMYIASCSLVVLLAFPVWASFARRFAVIPLLVATQSVAAILSLVCAELASLQTFWAVSLLMMLCKASYLLIYPHALSVEDKEQHLGTISLLAFVAYFGHVLSAAVSGFVLRSFDPRSLFWLMALGDLIQVALCAFWLRQARSATTAAPVGVTRTPSSLGVAELVKLGSVMLVLYFSAYVSEPFFAVYWERLWESEDKLVSGVVFAIPAIAALAALGVNTLWREGRAFVGGIVPALALGGGGLLLQASGAPGLVLCGRLLYGWALFQSLVQLDGLLFAASTRDSYAADFSKANLFQGVGVLSAGVSAGHVVATFGLRAPFLLAALGFGLGAALFVALFRSGSSPDARQEKEFAR